MKIERSHETERFSYCKLSKQQKDVIPITEQTTTKDKREHTLKLLNRTYVDIYLVRKRLTECCF
jgi:hypothetical protein